MDFDADALHKLIQERFDLSLGAGLGKLKGRMFRIGHLGDCNDLTLMAALSGVEMGLKALWGTARRKRRIGGDGFLRRDAVARGLTCFAASRCLRSRQQALLSALRLRCRPRPTKLPPTAACTRLPSEATWPGSRA